MMSYFTTEKRFSATKVLVLLALFLGFSVQGMAQQLKSDYEIQKEFKEKYEDLTQQLDAADSTATVQQITQEIKQLEETFAEHENLLNVALHPDTFNEEMERLKKRVLAQQDQLATIEEQEQKLQELSGQLTSYDSRLENLNNRTDSLQRAMQKSLKSEEQLSGMVRRYRKSLEQRDDLILSFVDSVMITYQKLNVESMQDLENAKKKARFNADGNALKMIQDIANENISLLNNEPNLSTEEYLRMGSVHSEFRTMWDKIGNKVVSIYADNEQEAKDSINSAIETWNEKLTAQTWASIDSSFNEAEIAIGSFNNGDSFYQALNTYLADAIKTGKNGSGGNKQQYQKFSSFWNDHVQAEWNPHIIDAGILSSQQIASIDQQLKQWASYAEPKSRLLAYLLGFSVLAIVALGFMLFREKRDRKDA